MGILKEKYAEDTTMGIIMHKIDTSNLNYAQIGKNATKLVIHWFHIIRKSQFAKALLPLGTVMIWNMICGFLPESVTNALAIMIFIAKNAFVVVFLLNIKNKIEKRMGDGELEATIMVDKQEWTNEGTFEKVKEQMTIGDYDISEWWKFIKTQAMQVGITMAIYMWKGFTVPLVIGSIFGAKAMFDLPLYKIHSLGLDEQDDETCKRPFKDANPMENFMQKYQESVNNTMGSGEQPTGAAKKISKKSLLAKEKATKAAQKKQK